MGMRLTTHQFRQVILSFFSLGGSRLDEHLQRSFLWPPELRRVIEEIGATFGMNEAQLAKMW